MSDKNKIDEVFKEIDDVIKNAGWRDYPYSLCKYLLDSEKTLDESYDLAFISVIKNYSWYFQRSISENSWMFFEYDKLLNFYKRLYKGNLGLPSSIAFNLYTINVINYDDIKDNLSKFSSNDISYIVNNVKFENLKDFTTNSDSKVRYQAYFRLGADANVDDMLKDKFCEIRLLGVNQVKYGDDRLKNLALNEKSGKVQIALAKKLSKNNLVFLIGKKSRSKWNQKYFEDILKTRMEAP